MYDARAPIEIFWLSDLIYVAFHDSRTIEIQLCVYVIESKSAAGFEVLMAVLVKGTIFWDITSCSPLKVNRLLGGTYRSACYQLHAGFMLGLLLALNMKATCSSETLVNFQRTR
jgi:hypothetical protein